MITKILIAEDSNVAKNMTQKILEMHDFRVESAKNGQQVLDKLEKETFQLLLLDINMPVMNGVECAHKIRKEFGEDKRNIPIIAVTGNDLEFQKEDFDRHGINDYVTKPLDYDLLLEKIRKHVA